MSIRNHSKCNHEAGKCLWSKSEKFCAMLRHSSVPLDNKWPLVILNLRGVKDIPTLSEMQKSHLQELLFVLLEQKDFSDARLEEVHKRMHAIITAPFSEKLNNIAKETSALAKDIHTMFGKHTQNMSHVADSIEESIALGKEPASILSGLRDTLRDVVTQMERDASALLSLSHNDSLTGLANRRAFDLFLSQAVERWTRDSTPVSLIMLDIDNFKRLNDTYGHLMGDQVLKSLAAQMKKIATSLDDDNSSVLAARFGGEEFAIVLFGEVTDLTVLVADNLRKTIQKTDVTQMSANRRVPSDLRVTVSVGVAELWSGWKGEYMRNLVDFADQALYHAKNSGRNCTALYMPEQPDSFVVLAQG